MSGRVIIILACWLLLSSCEREERSFETPPSSTQSPEAIRYNNRVRPGTDTRPTETSTQPVNLTSLLGEPFQQQFSQNAQALSDGQRLYEAYNCVGCHAHGGGGMAPPLIDNKWYYGSEPRQVYLSILEGRPNGMPSFRGRIPDYQIWSIAAYVRSISGHANTNAAGGREDHLNAAMPPNSIPPEKPVLVPQPTTGPATNSVYP